METEDSSPCSKQPNNCPILSQIKHGKNPSKIFMEDQHYYYFSIGEYVFKVGSFLQVSQPKRFIFLSFSRM